MLVSELLAGLAAKLAGLGLAAKAALGLGIATTAVTGAGAAGVLPDPAQHAVASVVNAVSPLQLPDPELSVDLDATTTAKVSVPDAGLTGDEDEGLTNDPTGDDPAGERKQNHGACVSAVAHDKTFVGREHGLAVSTAAKSDCGKENTSSGSSTTTSSTTTTTLGSSIASELDGGDNPGRGNSGGGSSGPSSNRGSSENRGQGNSGRGNSGK